MSRYAVRFAVVFGVLAALPSSGRAQFTGYGVGGQYLLQNKSVQQELRLTREQLGQLKTAVEKLLDANKDKLARLRDLSPEEQAKVMAPITEQSNKIVVGVLSDAQVKRLREIDLQQRGPMALYDPEVRKALRITDEQTTMLKALADRTMPALQKAYAAKDMRKASEIMRAAEEKLGTILTEEQKKTWAELLGKPFEVRPDGE
jgi:hypothetical protein